MEKMNKTIQDIIVSMLHHAKLLEGFWVEVICSTIQVTNLSLNTTINLKWHKTCGQASHLSMITLEYLYVLYMFSLSLSFVNNDFHYERNNTTMTYLLQSIEPFYLSRDLKTTMTPNSMPPYTPIQMANMMICDLAKFSLFIIWKVRKMAYYPKKSSSI